MKLPFFPSALVAGAIMLKGLPCLAENHLLIPGERAWLALSDPAGSSNVISFEKFFTSGSSKYTTLRLRVRGAEGLAIYLNGTEILRSNLPDGMLEPATLPLRPALDSEGGAYRVFRVSAEAVRLGRNVLRAEVHRATESPNAPAFDAELMASTDVRPVFITRGPYLQNATPDAITIRWRTDVPTVGRIKWGLSRRALENSATGPVMPTTEHEIRLTGLAAATKYFYAIRSQGAVTRGDTAEHSFRTLPSPGADVPLRIWILGDSGTGGDGTARAEQVREAYRRYAQTHPADVWLMLGDNAYPYGSDSDYQRALFDIFPTFLRKMTLWSALGNHETFSGEPNPYFNIFTFPTQGEAGGVPSGTEHYYSFDYGPVHFVCLDSQTSSRQPGGSMLTWLDSDLSACQAKWIIAYWHHPPYSRGSHDSDTTIEEIEMRQNALPILEAYGVDLAFAGHSHSYERSMLIDGHYGSSDTLQPGMIKDAGDGKLKGDGAYTKTADAHAGAVYTVCGVSGQVSGGTYDHPVMVKSLPTLGCLVVDVQGTRLNTRFLQSNGQIGDSFSIVKP